MSTDQAPERYSRRTLETSNGPLTVGEWAGDGPPVVAIHGVSSTHLLWLWTAKASPNLHLIAPDLRGRGGSVSASGSYGLEQHADDVLTVMDAFGIDRAVVVGMSMGGFVATGLAQKASDRMAHLLLVDGGPPMTPPTPGPKEEGLNDRLERTVRTFADVEEYKALFRAGVGALLDPDDPVLTEYLGYDLVGDAPHLSVRLAPVAVRQDAGDVFVTAPIEDWMAELTIPTTLLYAEWSIGPGSTAAYPEEVVDSWRSRLPNLQARQVPGVDHAASTMSDRGAAEIARELTRITTEVGAS